MAYRSDPDLEFLGYCSSAELDPIVRYLTCDKDGCARLTEGLTLHEDYKNHVPRHVKYWPAIAAELQRYGANTIASMFRGGQGVLYREILFDVCKKMKVDFSREAEVSTVESALLSQILTDSYEKMSSAEQEQLVRTLKLKTTNFSQQAFRAALQIAVNESGVVAYQVAIIVANAVANQVAGRGLTIAANAALAKSVAAFAGPVGWGITGLLTVVAIAGPAYRVTIPTVIHVAFLRFQIAQESIPATLLRRLKSAFRGI